MLLQETGELQGRMHARQGNVALDFAQQLPAGVYALHIKDLVRGKQEAQGQTPKQRLVRTLPLPQCARRDNPFHTMTLTHPPIWHHHYESAQSLTRLASLVVMAEQRVQSER